MDTLNLTAQVTSIRATLQAIESQLDRGRIPAEALDDFKAAVDDIRLRVWNIMAASKSHDYPVALERFRIRRAIDVSRSVAQELRSGDIQPDHPELNDLRHLAAVLIAAIDATAPSRA
jgi:soluble cytochrome b562